MAHGFLCRGGPAWAPWVGDFVRAGIPRPGRPHRAAPTKSSAPGTILQPVVRHADRLARRGRRRLGALRGVLRPSAVEIAVDLTGEEGAVGGLGAAPLLLAQPA